MNTFDKRMATQVIQDAFADLDTPHGRGMAAGLCGAFYMCGLLSEQEWKAYLRRIPAERYGARGDGVFADAMDFRSLDRDSLLN